MPVYLSVLAEGVPSGQDAVAGVLIFTVEIR